MRSFWELQSHLENVHILCWPFCLELRDHLRVRVVTNGEQETMQLGKAGRVPNQNGAGYLPAVVTASQSPGRLTCEDIRDCFQGRS